MAGNGDGGRSNSEKFNRYRQRFEEARNNPALVQGRPISGATVDCNEQQARDPQSGIALTLGRGESNVGYIMLYWPPGSPDKPLRGDAEPLRSDDGHERVTLLRNTLLLKAGGPLRHVLSEPQLQLVANLIATIQTGCIQRPSEISSFVLYEDEEASARSSTGG